jgi:hypothetical protein
VVAADVVLDEDPVALADVVPLDEVASGPGDDADVLVAHDDRVGEGR